MTFQLHQTSTDRHRTANFYTVSDDSISFTQEDEMKYLFHVSLLTFLWADAIFFFQHVCLCNMPSFLCFDLCIVIGARLSLSWVGLSDLSMCHTRILSFSLFLSCTATNCICVFMASCASFPKSYRLEMAVNPLCENTVFNLGWFWPLKYFPTVSSNLTISCNVMSCKLYFDKWNI